MPKKWGPEFPAYRTTFVGVGSQRYVLLESDNPDRNFQVATDLILQRDGDAYRQIDSRKFLERFGLNPQVTHSISTLQTRLSELGSFARELDPTSEYPLYRVTASGPSQPESFCDDTTCLEKSEDEVLNMLFANPAERTARGQAFVRNIQEQITTWRKMPTLDEKVVAIDNAIHFNAAGEKVIRESSLEEQLQNKLAIAKKLLGANAPEVKATQAELAAFSVDAQRAADIVATRIAAIQDIAGLTEMVTERDCPRYPAGLGITPECGKPYQRRKIRDFAWQDYGEKAKNDALFHQSKASTLNAPKKTFQAAQQYADEQLPTDTIVLQELAEKMEAFKKDFPETFSYLFGATILGPAHVLLQEAAGINLTITCDDGILDGCWSDQQVAIKPLVQY